MKVMPDANERLLLRKSNRSGGLLAATGHSSAERLRRSALPSRNRTTTHRESKPARAPVFLHMSRPTAELVPVFLLVGPESRKPLPPCDRDDRRHPCVFRRSKRLCRRRNRPAVRLSLAKRRQLRLLADQARS